MDVLLDASCLMNGLFGCEADAAFVAAMIGEVEVRRWSCDVAGEGAS